MIRPGPRLRGEVDHRTRKRKARTTPRDQNQAVEPDGWVATPRADAEAPSEEVVAPRAHVFRGQPTAQEVVPST